MLSEDYEGAIEAFTALDGYRDSNDQIEAAINAIRTQVSGMDAKSAAAELAGMDVELSTKLLMSMESKSAATFLAEMDRKTVNTLLANMDVKSATAIQMTNAKVGDTITFGHYEQDKKNDGMEPIEWIILAKETDRALLISKFALENMRYNNTQEFVTWSTCSLRSWLNQTYYKTAFTDEERDLIRSTRLSNPDTKFGGWGGSDTTDKIFLLSVDEARKYFSSDAGRKCAVTAKLVGYGGWWWLRSPGHDNGCALGISTDGEINEYGIEVAYSYTVLGTKFDSNHLVVRPALWLDL